MADIGLLQGAMSGLKLAADIAIGLNKINTIAEVNAKAIELQQIILNVQSSALNAQSEQAAMVQEIRDLKEEITRVKAWESQRQRYQLTPLGGGAAVVYLLKESMSESEPPHWICTKCYQDGKRAILQPKSKEGHTHLACITCGLEIPTYHRRISPPTYAK